MDSFLEQVSEWCRDAGQEAEMDGPALLRVGSTIEISHSVERLWLQQRIGVPASTDEAAAIAACHLTNFARRGPIEARWRVGHAELVGSVRTSECTKEAIKWLLTELEKMTARLLGQLTIRPPSGEPDPT